MTHRIAFAGFRHGHILSLWNRVTQHADCTIVAAWENDPDVRREIASSHNVSFTHDSLEQMLAQSDCSIVAIGDTYARRGPIAIAALRAGKHVIADKPLCTSIEELAQIEKLAEEHQLSIGCQLDLREVGVFRQLKKVIQEGILGKICTITATGQHPLLYGKRAAWYFEPGQHGGTINDIGVHFIDLAPWLTASKWGSTLAACTWNAKADKVPHFNDCAQFLATLENGISCFGDFSYLAPNKIGYTLPQYWRITVHGTQGMAETNYNSDHVVVATDSDTEPQKLPPLTDSVPGYLQNFLDEINGQPSTTGLTTQSVLATARKSLEIQQLANPS